MIFVANTAKNCIVAGIKKGILIFLGGFFETINAYTAIVAAAATESKQLNKAKQKKKIFR